MKKGLKAVIWILGIAILIAIIGFAVNYYFFNPPATGDFETDTLFLKLAINENDAATSSIRMTNTNPELEKLSVVINGAGDMLQLDEKEFEVEVGNMKVLNVKINSSGKSPGVYLGQIIISSHIYEPAISTKKIIPIILEIQSKDVYFDSNLNLYPQGRDFIPGDRVNTEIKIFDLRGVGKSNVRLAYFVKSFDGKNIVSESEDIVVDSKLDYSRTIELPMNTEVGSYVFYSTLDYNGSIGTSSQLFWVADAENTQTNNNLILYVVIIFSFFFLIFLGLFVYSVLFRDRMLKEMDSRYRSEIRRQRDLIGCQEKRELKKLGGINERRLYKSETKRIEGERLKLLNEIKRKKTKEYKQIKKKYKGDKLKIRLNQWKRQGYNTSMLETKYKLPNAVSIKKKIAEWKKKGYNTQILEDKLKK